MIFVQISTEVLEQLLTDGDPEVPRWNASVFFSSSEPSWNLKQIVFLRRKKNSDVVLIKTRTKRNEWNKAFQVVVLQRSAKVAFARTYGFFSPLERKRYTFVSENRVWKLPCSKSTYMNPSGTPAVTRPQTFTNWWLLGTIGVFKRILCQ